MALELGSHPKPPQIAEALVDVYGYGAWPPARGHLGVGEKALLRQMKPVFVFTLCLPEGNMSKEAQRSEPLRH